MKVKQTTGLLHCTSPFYHFIYLPVVICASRGSVLSPLKPTYQNTGTQQIHSAILSDCQLAYPRPLLWLHDCDMCFEILWKKYRNAE